MILFPFDDMAEAIVDQLKSDEFSAFTSEIVSHDDHWYRPANIQFLQARTPAIYVELFNAEINKVQDGDCPEFQVGTFYRLTRLRRHDDGVVDRKVLTTEIRAIIEHLTNASTELQVVPGFTPPTGVMIQDFYPAGIANFDELLDFGLIGINATFQVESYHGDPDLC